MAGMSFAPTSRSVTINKTNVLSQNFIGMFSISGRITDSATGQGIEGVQVKRSTGSSTVSVFTDATGNYRFPDTRSGDYTISAEMNGKTFTPSSRATTVGTQNITNVNFVQS